MDSFHIKRIAPPFKAFFKKNVLLSSPRQTGKSWLLKSLDFVDLHLDLQDFDTFRKLSFQKAILENLITPEIKTISLDNVHLLPQVLDQVAFLNKSKNVRFIISTSQKLKDHLAIDSVNAETVSLQPFCYPELSQDFSLDHVLRYGTLPSILGKKHQDLLLNDYVGQLLRTDLIQSGKIRKVENFSRFLNIAAELNGQFLNYVEISKLCSVPSRTVREYYELLKDFNLGYEVQSSPTHKGAKRSKFYFFDIGVANALKNDFNANLDFEQTEASLKHFVLLELIAFKKYRSSQMKIEFWCDYHGHEIDFLINGEIALEIKAAKSLTFQHTKRLKKFSNRFSPKKSFVISRDPQSLTVEKFLADLWSGKII